MSHKAKKFTFDRYIEKFYSYYLYYIIVYWCRYLNQKISANVVFCLPQLFPMINNINLDRIMDTCVDEIWSSFFIISHILVSLFSCNLIITQFVQDLLSEAAGCGNECIFTTSLYVFILNELDSTFQINL